eukprot:921173-Amphidinium_carterae.1
MLSRHCCAKSCKAQALSQGRHLSRLEQVVLTCWAMKSSTFFPTGATHWKNNRALPDFSRVLDLEIEPNNLN